MCITHPLRCIFIADFCIFLLTHYFGRRNPAFRKRLEGGSGRHPPCHSLTVAGELSDSVLSSDQILTAESSWAEYHLCHGGNQSPCQLCLANAGIRTGDAPGNHFNPLALPLLSLKCKFKSWDSPSKLVPIQRNCGDGASATETGATFQNGCSTRGESRWIQTPVGESVRS